MESRAWRVSPKGEGESNELFIHITGEGEEEEGLVREVEG